MPTAIVTGSGRGIGRAIAINLAEEGYNVVVNSLHKENAQRVAEEIGTNAISIEGNIAEEDICKNIIERTLDKFGSIDLLVNNAGMQKATPIDKISSKEWDLIMNVNLRGAFLCSREAAKYMIKANKGCIINVSSVHYVIPKPLYAHYATSKAGLVMLTKTMALELARHNIRVNAIAPGAIDTDMNKDLRDVQKLKKAEELIPIGRIGSAEEVSNLIIFLASEKASYITGSIITVDGGLTLYPSYGIELKEGSEEYHESY
ncbi:MAG: glucose 1-dehydrogenase [Candidatus Nitrosothermus koennekii]|nr:MAG: glucose 1-dehydrogenase [Candidatus Nitrosothermus koennekii]